MFLFLITNTIAVVVSFDYQLTANIEGLGVPRKRRVGLSAVHGTLLQSLTRKNRCAIFGIR